MFVWLEFFFAIDLFSYFSLLTYNVFFGGSPIFFRSHRGNVPPVMVRRELRLLGKSWRLNTVRRARRFRRRMKETSVTRCACVLRHFH